MTAWLMIGLPRFSSDICLISWRMIDMMFPFCGLSGFLRGGRDVIHQRGRSRFAGLFWSRLLEWKHDDRARCLASADELVRGCSLPKRKGFDNVARYYPLRNGIEKGFCSAVDFASVRHVMRKHGTGDNERSANAQIFDEVDRIRNA